MFKKKGTMEEKLDNLCSNNFIKIAVLFNIALVFFVVFLEYSVNGTSNGFSMLFIPFGLLLHFVFYSLVILKKLENRINTLGAISLGVFLFFGLLSLMSYILLPCIIAYVVICLRKKENFRKSLRDWLTVIGVNVLGFMVDMVLAAMFINLIFRK